jgi:autotransporter-associated beta strand protein
MFSIRKPFHQTSRVVSIGAASIGIVLSGSAVKAATLYFDPGDTINPPSGGSGAFSNGSGNFSDLTNTNLSPVAGTGGNYYDDGDNVVFSGTGGAVTVSDGTIVRTMTISPVSGNYTFTNSGYLSVMNSTLSGYDGPGEGPPQFVPPPGSLINTSGHNTIGGTLEFGYGNGLQHNSIEVAAGSSLTLNNLIRGKSNGFAKIGDGLLRVNGQMGGHYATARLRIHAGTFEFNGTTTTHHYGGVAHIYALGGTLSGTGTVNYALGRNWVAFGDAEPSNQFDIRSGATFSPGSAASPVGTFSIRGARRFGLRADLETGSRFAIDLVAPDSAAGVHDGSHDVFKYTGGQYGLFGAPTETTDTRLTIHSGAIVDINGGVGPLTPGTYHIIQLWAGSGDGGSIEHTVDLVHNPASGFVIGNAPTGYTYTFVNAASTGQNNLGFDGIDLIIALAAGVVDATWQTNVDGNWSTGANWTPGVPNSAGSTANFTGNTLAAVNVDVPVTVGRILFSGATDYTLGGSAITLDNTGGVGTNMVIESAGGTQVINSALTTTAGTVEVNVNGGSVTLGGAIGGPAALVKNGAGTLLLNGSSNYAGTTTLNGGTLGGSGTITSNVVAGAAAHTIAPSAGLPGGSSATLTVGGLTTNANTTLAFNLVTPGASSNNAKIIVTSSSSLIINGGNIIISDSATGAGSLGYYKAIQYTGTIGGTGVSSLTLPAVSAGKIVYTLDLLHDPGFIDLHRGFEGDANDDGTVTFSDFVSLANNFGGANAGWGGGDFNGDGTTNFTDFVTLANNFGATVGSGAIVVSAEELALFQSASASFLAGISVPEPASLMLLGLGATGLLARRRRH